MGPNSQEVLYYSSIERPCGINDLRRFQSAFQVLHNVEITVFWTEEGAGHSTILRVRAERARSQ